MGRKDLQSFFLHTLNDMTPWECQTGVTCGRCAHKVRAMGSLKGPHLLLFAVWWPGQVGRQTGPMQVGQDSSFSLIICSVTVSAW